MASDIQTLDVTVVSVATYEQPGKNWKPFINEHGHEIPFEPSMVLEIRPMGASADTTVEKVKIKKIGLGEKNEWMKTVVRKGGSYSMTIARGTYNDTPWSAVNDIPFFYDVKGQPQRLKPATTSTTPTHENVPITEKPVAPPPPKNTAGEKLPPGAAKFLDQALFVPQSDAWWEVKNHFNIDGAIISNAFNYAAILLSNTENLTKEIIIKWAEWFESEMRRMHNERIETRLRMMFCLATSKEQITEIVNMAWARLPYTHYGILRGFAKERLDAIAKNPVPLDVTPQPEPPEVGENEQMKWAKVEPPKEPETTEDIPF